MVILISSLTLQIRTQSLTHMHTHTYTHTYTDTHLRSRIPRSAQLMVTWRISSSVIEWMNRSTLSKWTHQTSFSTPFSAHPKSSTPPVTNPHLGKLSPSHSPKHCEYSSLLTGQIPVSRACRCWSLISSCSWRLMTSSRVAGVLETHWRHSWLSSVHSLQKQGGFCQTQSFKKSDSFF